MKTVEYNYDRRILRFSRSILALIHLIYLIHHVAGDESKLVVFVDVLGFRSRVCLGYVSQDSVMWNVLDSRNKCASPSLQHRLVSSFTLTL